MPDLVHHRDIQGGVARAGVFGASDGLVTNVSLILGVAGANPGVGIVRLAGLAGLVAGAFSMAAGEYVSMKAQSELFERELALERRELELHPEGERKELAHIYESRGVDPALAHQMAHAMMKDTDMALEVHAREELGIDPQNLGSPWKAAFSSFVAFSVGALLPLIPWFFMHGTNAVMTSVIIGALASFSIGAALSTFTGKSLIFSALRQVGISA
ncbi:MAG: hypothetical protein HKL80_08765, partial [Acidimicrobiales bacterium]|nr:hypothetical protein [Acidimicrobiales bacterium]